MTRRLSAGRRGARLLGLSALLLALVWLGPCAGALRADARTDPAFPVPRAEKEFLALIPSLQDYCGSVTKGDSKAFIVAASAYGPLDLQVRKARSPREASQLRFFHLGVAAAISGVSRELAGGLGRPFKASPADVRRRKQEMVAELPQIRAFVGRFQAVPRITLLARWGFTGEYRVNDTFHMRGRTDEAIPSPVMGFVPSGRWRHYKMVQEYLDTLHVSEPAFAGLYGAFLPLPVASARRTEGGDTEVLGLGLADNASGLLFTRAGASGPAAGQRLPSGARYSVVERVGPGVFYFETA